MPRAYIEITLSSKPGRRRAYFSTSCGSNFPCRSRGTSRSIAPESVSTRLMRLHLHVQGALRDRLLQIVDQRPAAEHLRRVLAGQKLVEDVVADLPCCPCSVRHCVPSLVTQMLRPSNTGFLTGSRPSRPRRRVPVRVQTPGHEGPHRAHAARRRRSPPVADPVRPRKPRISTSVCLCPTTSPLRCASPPRHRAPSTPCARFNGRYRNQDSIPQSPSDFSPRSDAPN